MAKEKKIEPKLETVIPEANETVETKAKDAQASDAILDKDEVLEMTETTQDDEVKAEPVQKARSWSKLKGVLPKRSETPRTPEQNTRLLSSIAIGMSAIALATSLTLMLSPKETSLDRFKERVDAIAKDHGVPTPQAFDPKVKDTGDLIVTEVAPTRNDKKSEESTEPVPVKETAAPQKDTTVAKAQDVKPQETQPKAESEEVKAFKEMAKNVPAIDKIVRLPMEGVRAVAGKDGKIMYMGENGRFVIIGELYDMWARKPLKTIDEITFAANHIDVKQFGLKPEGMNTFTLGNAKAAERVTAFVDPQCSWCHALIDDVQKAPDLLNRYAFDFYVVPALGDRSHDLAKRFYCAKATSDEKVQAFMKGAQAIDALATNPDCDTKGYDQTLVSAQLLGVEGVPFIIAPDGRYVSGKPRDIKAFLTPVK